MKTVEKSQLLFVLSPLQLCLLVLFISWPILYLLVFTTQPEFILGDTQNFLKNFESGSGIPMTTPNGNLSNTLLSDKGRETVLWVSFLISLLITLLLYFVFLWL